MPELPEVETIVRQLRPDLEGRRIEGARVFWARTVQPSRRLFLERIAGRTIRRLWRRAKYFVFDLDGGWHLVGHLRMTGRLYVGPRAGADHLRVAFDLDDGRVLSFVDVRKFGRLAVVRDLAEALPALGPEPLSDEVDGAWMRAALSRRKRKLKPLLLDQAFLAGLGNIYVDEALHRARLHPLQSSHRVKGHQAEALVTAVREVLTAAIAADGSSFDTFYRTPEGQPGAYQDDFDVYGRTGKPCRRCGATIVRIVVGQRATHLCRRCQRAPRGLAGGGAA